jgi:hypothetical protein
MRKGKDPEPDPGPPSDYWIRIRIWEAQKHLCLHHWLPYFKKLAEAASLLERNVSGSHQILGIRLRIANLLKEKWPRVATSYPI